MEVREEINVAMVLCEVRKGLGKVDASVAVRDTADVQTFLQVDRDFPTQRNGQWYLPIGLVHRDKDKGVALIEFPVEADSGTHRLWVPLSAIVESNGAHA